MDSDVVIALVGMPPGVHDARLPLIPIPVESEQVHLHCAQDFGSILLM
jgi:hypothetical protein